MPEEAEDVVDTTKTEIIFPKLSFKQRCELFFSKEEPPREENPAFFWWYPPNQSKEEKNLVFKLDCFILSYVCLSYWSKYLDQSNISSAYVSGMKEDLELHGAQYNWIQNCFTIGYGIGGLISLLMTRVSPNIILPGCEVIWAVFCLSLYKSNSFKYVAVMRFFQGTFEGCSYPAIYQILGTYYNKNEIARRAGIFTSSGMVGSMFSGYFQAAVYKNLNGVNGIEGWRWLFIVDFAVTIPIAIIGFFVLIPRNARKVWWLKESELTLARDRMKFRGKPPTDRWDWNAVKRILTSWQFYLFPSAFILWDLSGQGGSYFAIIMKGLGGYSVYQLNTIPTAQTVFRIITCLVSGLVIDITATRWHSMLTLMGLWITGLAILVAWAVPRGALFFGIILLGVSTPFSPIWLGWLNRLTQEDVQLRFATISVMNLFSSLLEIPWNVKLFNTDYAPRYFKAYRWCLGLNSILLLYVPLAVLFERYQNRKRALYKVEVTKNGVTTIEDFFKTNSEKDTDSISLRSLNVKKSGSYDIKEKKEADVNVRTV